MTEAAVIGRKLSLISSTGESRSRTASVIDNCAVVPSIIAEDERNADEIPLFSVRQIYKDFIIISLAFILMFTSYTGILTLQSSLNSKGNVGVNSLIIIYAFTLFSSLFLTNILMDILGLKWTMMIGKIAYISYICANIWPMPILMYIGAALLGLGSAPLWTSVATYISRIARYYAYHKEKKVGNIVSLFFGVFYAVLGTCTIWGNMISYFVLNQSNTTQKFNCGIYFDPLSKNDSNVESDVSDLTRNVLCGIFIAVSILSLILLLSLDQIRLATSQPVLGSLKKSIEVIRSLFRWKYIDQLFLIPITIWTMMESAFLLAQFTRAFITCLVGIQFIGLVMICNGILNSIFSYFFGSLVKCIGRLGCFIIAAGINYSAIMLMYFWKPQEDEIYILFIIAGMWGIASAVWQSQVVAVYTVLYSETDSSALTKYRVWKAVGSLVTYSFASYITIQLTLFILFCTLTFSMVCYGIAEIYVRRKNRVEKLTLLINQY